MKRFFYVVDLPKPKLQRVFDSIRAVCDPHQKNRAHITVRGPYRQRYRMTAVNARIRGTPIEIDGPGAFFENGQHTVYLRCKSDALRDAWSKGDFGYAPHLTLYDGPSRRFAHRLFDLVTKIHPRVRFTAKKLTPLVSRAGQRGFGAAIELTDDDLYETFGQPLRYSDLESLSDDSRLDLVERGLMRLSSLGQDH